MWAWGTGEGFKVAYSCQGASCDGYHLTPAFQRIFDSILRIIGMDTGRGPGTRSIKARQGSFKAFLYGGLFHEHGQSTSHPRILMVELATHILPRNYFLSVCGMCWREACMNVTLASLSMQYQRPLRTHIRLLESDSLTIRYKTTLQLNVGWSRK